MNFEGLPGGELIRQGLNDLGRNSESVASLLVSIGASRLRKAGVPVPPDVFSSPEHSLYQLLSISNPDSAHSRYNALIRKLVSFELAVTCAG